MSMDGKNLKNGLSEEEKLEEQLDEQLEKNLEEQLKSQTEEVEVPNSLKPDSIEKMLYEKAGKKKWKPIYTIAAAAACCMVVIGVVAIGSGGRKGTKGEDTSAKADTVQSEGYGENGDGNTIAEDKNIASAKDYDDIYQYIKAEKENQESADSSRGYLMQEDSTADGGRAGASTNESAKLDSAAVENSTSYSDTNIRQEGVAEGDIIKTDGKRLYILNGQKVQIVDIQNEEMEQLGAIRLEDDQNISELYIKEDKLIVVYTRTEYDDGENGYQSNYKQYTVAETYDVSNPKEPKSVGEVTQSGSFHTMRISGDYVYLFSDFYANVQAAKRDTGSYIPEVNGKLMDSSNILLPQYIRGSQYTVVSSFSLKNPDKKVDNKAVFGSAGLVYVSNENIYVCESYYNSEDSNVTQTCIRKVAYKDGQLNAVGQTRIDGTLNDSFSIDEYEGNLRLVTTVSSTGNSSPFPLVIFDSRNVFGESNEKDSNSLYILDENLEELSRIEGLAEDESVYSARFMGDTGYFVTYKQVDPLFSVDLSNPKKPEIIGKLKIPGFSDYLHPYGDGLLLGIGMDVDETGTTTNGVKVSMFDILDPSDVKEVQKYVLEDTYSTNVSYNYKAALISTDKNLIGFSAYGQSQHYYLFSYDEKEGFQCIFDRELNGYSEARGVYSGDTFYVVAGNTVESYTMDSFKKIDDIVL